MRYQRTIDLWANSGQMQDLIRDGQLKLQIGQWVQCGKGPKSRYVGIRPSGVFYVAHSEGAKGCRDSFPRLLSAWRGKKVRR